MKFILFVTAAVLLGLVGILGIYLRFFAVVFRIAVEGGKMLVQRGRRLRTRPVLGYPSYDH